MPVVMTGSPGGSLGGNGGGSFGSGLAGVVSSPPKLFTPALETWMKRAEEDASMLATRKADYEGTRDARLEMVADQKRKEAQQRKKQNKLFTDRQKARIEAEAAEKKRVEAHRQEALAKPTLGSSKPPWDGLHTSSPIPVDTLSCPVHWVYPTAKKHPESLSVGDLSAEHKAAMLKLPSNVEMDMLTSYVDNCVKNSFDLRRKAAEVRKQRDDEDDERDALKKAEREAEAKAMREEEDKKKAAAEAAALARSKQIKKEMASEAAKEAKDEAARSKSRHEKAMHERAENVKHLLMDTKLRDEDEFANERREGSSMSKGGRDEFLKAAKEEGDMSGF